MDIDLGSERQVASFDLLTPPRQSFVLPGGVCFEIQAKTGENEAWKRVYESSGEAAENNFNLTGIPLNVSARYFRLILNGNYNVAPVGDDRYVHAVHIQEFTLYDADGNNVSLNKATAGSASDFSVVTDGARGGELRVRVCGRNFQRAERLYLLFRKGFGRQGRVHFRKYGKRDALRQRDP